MTAYEASSSRRLTASAKERAPSLLPLVAAEVEDAQSMFADATVLPYANDLVRGNLCAFVSSSAEVIGETDATVRSVLTFMPGMRTAIAVSDQDLSLFKR